MNHYDSHWIILGNLVVHLVCQLTAYQSTQLTIYPLFNYLPTNRPHNPACSELTYRSVNRSFGLSVNQPRNQSFSQTIGHIVSHTVIQPIYPMARHSGSQSPSQAAAQSGSHSVSHPISRPKQPAN